MLGVMREFTTNPDLAEQTWEAVWGMDDGGRYGRAEKTLLLHFTALYCYTKGRYQFRFGLSQSRNINMPRPPWAAWYSAAPRARGNGWNEARKVAKIQIVTSLRGGLRYRTPLESTKLRFFSGR